MIIHCTDKRSAIPSDFEWFYYNIYFDWLYFSTHHVVSLIYYIIFYFIWIISVVFLDWPKCFTPAASPHTQLSCSITSNRGTCWHQHAMFTTAIVYEINSNKSNLGIYHSIQLHSITFESRLFKNQCIFYTLQPICSPTRENFITNQNK